MAIIGAWVAKFTAAMGGAPAAAAIVGGGLVVGLLAGAAAGSGALGPSPAPSIVVSELYPCPDMGPPLMTIKSGQHVWITGKTADLKWIRVHFGSGGRLEAWAPADPYSVLGSLDDVPVAECSPEALLAIVPPSPEPMTEIGSFEPTAVPTASPTPPPASTPTPTPAPTRRATPRPTARVTPRPPTPRPTPPPDTSPPSVGAPHNDGEPRIGDKDSGGCAQTGTKTVISAEVNDPQSGISDVRFFWIDSQTGAARNKGMSYNKSTGLATTTVDTVPLGIDQGLYNGRVSAVNGEGLRRDGPITPGILSVFDCS